MLTLTENASAIVNEITTQEGLPQSAGLRISTDLGADPAGGRGPEPTFEISAASAAQPGDQVVEQGGATVYLDGPAAQLLDDKVLDAAVDPTGRVEFALALQA